MKKILPLVRIFEVENYISNGVDAVVMGTYFSAKAQASIFDLHEIIEVNEKIPVYGLFNRDFKSNEQHQLIHEIKSLYEGGIDKIILSDEDVVNLIIELELDLNIIFLSEDASFDNEKIEKLKRNGVDEIWIFNNSSLEEKLKLAEGMNINIGLHFFGNRFLETKESGEEAPFEIKDNHGVHRYTENMESSIHNYGKIKERGVSSIYFETFASNLDDILFVVRSIDMVDDYKEFEKIVMEITEKEVVQGE